MKVEKFKVLKKTTGGRSLINLEPRHLPTSIPTVTKDQYLKSLRKQNNSRNIPLKKYAFDPLAALAVDGRRVAQTTFTSDHILENGRPKRIGWEILDAPLISKDKSELLGRK